MFKLLFLHKSACLQLLPPNPKGTNFEAKEGMYGESPLGCELADDAKADSESAPLVDWPIKYTLSDKQAAEMFGTPSGADTSAYNI